jgi:putative acetyltransferase
MTEPAYELRRAHLSDADDIAAAHRDSIHSIGAGFYPPDVVESWAEGVNAEVYIQAMARGEVFFIAEGEMDGRRTVLGFSSHREDDEEHATAVYVRGSAARRGIGSALFRVAEANALASGASGIHIRASLAAVEFYKANGFVEVGRGEHRLPSGRMMACVFMRKTLTTAGLLPSE